MGIETAIIGAGLLGAGATIYGANEASDASQSATDAATRAQIYGIDWQKEQYYNEQRRRQPFYDVGVSSLGGLKDMMSGTYDITSSPLYQANAAALEKDTSKWLSARGLQGSGAGVLKNVNAKANLMNIMQTQRFSELATLANLGQAGFAQAPNLTGAYGNLATSYMQGGALQANKAGMWAGAGALPLQAFNAYSLWNYLNKNTGSGMTPEMTAWDMYS